MQLMNVSVLCHWNSQTHTTVIFEINDVTSRDNILDHTSWVRDLLKYTFVKKIHISHHFLVKGDMHGAPIVLKTRMMDPT